MELAEFMVKEIEEKLAGGKITGAIISEDKEYFGFKVEFTKKSKKPALLCWIDMDAEGNGAGWINIGEEV